jgi:FAD:protein FMN transferase
MPAHLPQPMRQPPAAPGTARARHSGAWFSRDEAIMGTAIRVELWSSTPALAETVMSAVMAEMHRIDRAMSPHKHDSELSRINREAAQHPVPLSGEMYMLVDKAIEYSVLSGGAFDITYAAVGQLYDYRERVRPSETQLAAARACIGHQHLLLDPQRRTLRFAREGVRIDLGGFAKGYAVDQGARILREHGIAHGIVTAGGDSHIVGDRRGRPWMIGIRHPRAEGEVVAMLPLEDTALSTSGDYERYFDADGTRFHHLIDPHTGRSPTGVQSVSILAANGLASEAFSKCVFVMGPERGLHLIDSQDGVDAVVIDAHGELHYSSGLRNGAPPTTTQRPDPFQLQPS